MPPKAASTSFQSLQELYELELDYQHVLELDSSTAAKFSRHLIIRLPGHAFADNGALGCFVATLLKEDPPDLIPGPSPAASQPSAEDRSLVQRMLLHKVCAKHMLCLPTGAVHSSQSRLASCLCLPLGTC